MRTIFLHAISFTKLNTKKTFWRKKKRSSRSKYVFWKAEEVSKAQHCSSLWLPWLPSGKLMSKLMEFCPKSLLCLGSWALCCFSQGPHELLQTWMMQKNSERSLQGNRGSKSIELSWHYFIACLNTWDFSRYKFDSRSLKNIYIIMLCLYFSRSAKWVI